MRSPASSSAAPDPPRRRRRLPALIAIAVAGVLLLPPASGQAVPTAPEDPRKKLDELEEKADGLAEKYHGRVQELDEATEAADRASERVEELERDWKVTRERVAELAAARFKSGAIDPMIMVAVDGSLQDLADRAATADYLARTGDAQLRELQRLQTEARQARQEAKAQVDRANELVDRLEARKAEVAELIARYQAEDEARQRREAAQAARDAAGDGSSARGGSSSGGSSSGGSSSGGSSSGGSSAAPHPRSPVTGGGPITPRMRQVLGEVDQRFGPFPSIGCYRGGSSGEHPRGRACDFMLSTGGTMPSAGMVDRGWQVARWARANASRLGVMYVIYRQQIWDARSGGGWRPMGNRGSITANHYDHVHISVF